MKTQYKAAASLTVHRIDEMTETGLKDVCRWLRKQARDIERHPKSYAKTFRARYLYADA